MNIIHTFEHVTANIDVNFSLIIGLVIFINAGYWLLHKYFESNALYAELPFHRKRYVIKNVLKCIYLSIATCFVSFIVFDFIWYNNWSNYYIHNMGIMYMLPDLISLLRVPQLDRNTVQHHVCVVILATLNLFCDYSKDTYWRGMVIYAFMSMLTGSVNGYLGYRLLTNSVSEKKTIATFAYYNYLGSIIINWSYQLYIVYSWLFVEIAWGLYIYMGVMYFIVKDDLILLSFLQYASVSGK